MGATVEKIRADIEAKISELEAQKQGLINALKAMGNTGKPGGKGKASAPKVKGSPGKFCPVPGCKNGFAPRYQGFCGEHKNRAGKGKPTTWRLLNMGDEVFGKAGPVGKQAPKAEAPKGDKEAKQAATK